MTTVEICEYTGAALIYHLLHFHSVHLEDEYAAPAYDGEVLEEAVRNCYCVHGSMEDNGIAAVGSDCSVAVENRSLLALL